MRTPARVWTREALLRAVWDTDWATDTHLVEVHIGNLRRKLGERPGSPAADPHGPRGRLPHGGPGLTLGRAVPSMVRLLAGSAEPAWSRPPPREELVVFDLINGIPIHPLVVHAVVVLLPLAALGTIAIALRPAWRRRYGPLVVAAAALAAILCPVATSSGEALEKHVGDPGEHAELGDQLIWFVLPLLVLALALVLLDRRQRAAPRPAASPNPSAAGRQRRTAHRSARLRSTERHVAATDSASRPSSRWSRLAILAGWRQRPGLPGRGLRCPRRVGRPGLVELRVGLRRVRRLSERRRPGMVTVGLCEDDPAIRRVVTQALEPDRPRRGRRPRRRSRPCAGSARRPRSTCSCSTSGCRTPTGATSARRCAPRGSARRCCS